MCKQILLLAAMILFNFITEAQKGNSQVELIAGLSTPDKTYKTGYGGFMKGLYGVGKSAQLTITAGLSLMSSKNSGEIGATDIRLIPFLLGYKQHIKNFYIEPQAGFGDLGGRVDLGGDWARPSVAAFFGAVGVGYNIKRLDIGIRYQTANGVDGKGAGSWHNKTVNQVGVHIGYYIINCKK